MLPIRLAGWTLLAIGMMNAQKTRNAPASEILTIQQRIASGDLQGAQVLLTQAARQYPADGGVENLLGVVEIQQGHADTAKKAFSESIRLSPRLTSAYLNLARLLQMEQPAQANRKEALALYQQVLRVEPSNGEAHYQTAILLLQTGDFAASQKELTHLDAQARAQANVQAVACADAFGLQQVASAETAFEDLLKSPDLTEEDAVLVLPSLRSAHRADLVDRLYSAVAERRPLTPAGVRTLGLAQEAEGHLQAARETLNRAFTLDPSNVLPLVDLTRVALSMRDDQAALGYLAHARALQPRDAEFAFEFGVICLKLKLLGEALKAMGEALHIAPENPEYNLEYGALTMLADDPARALPYLIKYKGLQPGDPQGDLALGAAYFAHSEYDKAEPWLLLAAKQQSTAGAADFYLGSIKRRRGEPAKALADLKASEQQSPQQADVHAELGQAYMELGQLTEAATELERATALDPNSYAANFALVRLYARTGDARQKEQLARFQQLREHQSEEYSQAMRVIESRPLAQMTDAP